MINDDCKKPVTDIKAMMSFNPILWSPNFDKPFKIAVDASDMGAVAVLLQTDVNEIEPPVWYFWLLFCHRERSFGFAVSTTTL